MANEFWINLPVKDLQRAMNFYTKLGFTIKPIPGNREDGLSMVLGSKEIILMLFKEPAFRNFSGTEIADTSKGTEVLFSLDASEAAEVDKIASDVMDAGGKIFAEPGKKEDQMYGCGFMDPDGHRWTVVQMNESKIPRNKMELQVP